MTDNTMDKRKRRNQSGNVKPYIELQTIQWLKEKGETKGKSETINRMTDNTMVNRKRRNQREIGSLTSNDRKYNG